MSFADLLIAATAVLAATTLGGLAILLFKCPSQRARTILLSFAAGMMALSAAQMAYSAHQTAGNYVLLAGFALGTFTLLVLEKFLPHLHLVLRKTHLEPSKQKVALIVGTITIHNIPEGFAVASAFAAGGPLGWLVASSIAAQDVPEGFLVSAPLACYGVSVWRSIKFALLSGLVEFAAAVGGYLFLASASWLAPWALAFSAGAMAYVILVELLPDAFQKGFERTAATAFVSGAAAALVIELLLAVPVP